MKKKVVAVIIIIGLFTVAGGLCLNRILPKDFDSLLSVDDDRISGGTVSNPELSESVELNIQQLDELLDILDDAEFYYEGRYGNVMYGNLYQVILYTEADGKERVALRMNISDENTVYTEQKQYEMRPERTSVVEFLEGLF